MENIHMESIIKSFFLGLFIGVILQFHNNTDVLLMDKVLSVLASGSVGFIIGFITEWLTSILPISLANARTYFLINGIIALFITTLIMLSLMLIDSSNTVNSKEFIPVLLIVLGIVCIANVFDYMMYRRTQKKLHRFKALIKDQ